MSVSSVIWLQIIRSRLCVLWSCCLKVIPPTPPMHFLQHERINNRYAEGNDSIGTKRSGGSTGPCSLRRGASRITAIFHLLQKMVSDEVECELGGSVPEESALEPNRNRFHLSHGHLSCWRGPGRHRGPLPTCRLVLSSLSVIGRKKIYNQPPRKLSKFNIIPALFGWI